MTKSNSLKADELLYTDNYSSWRRMLRLAGLYRPLLQPAIIGYFFITLALCIVTGIGCRYGGADKWSVIMLAIPINIMWACSPVSLTRRDYRFVSKQLPVTATEKLWFLLITYLIVFPVIITTSLTVGGALLKLCNVVSLESVLPGYSRRLIALGLIQLIILTVISLYYTVTSTNRSFAGIISCILAYLSLLVASAVVMFCLGVYQGYMDAVNNVETCSSDMPQLIERAMVYSQYAISGIFIIVGLIYIRKLYKYLRNSGF